ncbi:heterocyst specific ABC-transporter, membrane fusion protein DevB [Scytonema sp. HK-05]|uniref:ABC exporter membrane fusion protein n=1 Tax=Scytonema sp. HK-05 TaxID=1137095 RepID=UPI000937DD02|nr:ABC exporter membrane fusion protein [Scytonema sp. HK-05]OKH52907.1 HlyD family secretion protein [Scytonema sp. HK-05]BAY49696.1 heterocyst specific ABC-transporter, membrane fusion protein DevB [Scytonema sp. HK-05]
MNLHILLKRLHRWRLALILGVTAITGTTVFYGISPLTQTSKPSRVVEAAPTIRQITALGRLEPVTEVIKVSVPATLTNDRVTKLLVQRGDRVKAGQVIAIMDAQARLQNALLETQAQVKVLQADLAKVKAGAKSGEIAAQEAEIIRTEQQLKGEIATQQASITRWQTEVRTANADYNRYLSLYKEGATSASELDRKRLTLDTAQAQLNEAKARQNQSANTLQEQIRQAKATLNKIAEVRPVDVLSVQAQVEKAITTVKKAKADLAEAYIRAPIAGRILNIYAKPGEVVGEKGIADLGQTDQMQVVAEVYKTDIGKVREGQQAIITSESFPGQVRGIVRLIGLQVLQQEVTSGKPGENLDRKVIEVRIRLNVEDSQKVANFTNLQVQVAIQPNLP